jgi:hypothetical protein
VASPEVSRRGPTRTRSSPPRTRRGRRRTRSRAGTSRSTASPNRRGSCCPGARRSPRPPMRFFPYLQHPTRRGEKSGHDCSGGGGIYVAWQGASMDVDRRTLLLPAGTRLRGSHPAGQHAPQAPGGEGSDPRGGQPRPPTTKGPRSRPAPVCATAAGGRLCPWMTRSSWLRPSRP